VSQDGHVFVYFLSGIETSTELIQIHYPPAINDQETDLLSHEDPNLKEHHMNLIMGDNGEEDHEGVMKRESGEHVNDEKQNEEKEEEEDIHFTGGYDHLLC